MSDADLASAPYFALYSGGEVTADDIGDHLHAWHNAGDDEQRSLPEYLGMTDEEYAIWAMDGRTLPLLLLTRQSGGSLREAVASYLGEMLEHQRRVDRTAIHALTHWIARNPPP